MIINTTIGETGVKRYRAFIISPANLVQFYTHIDAFSEPKPEDFTPLFNKLLAGL